MSAPVVPGGIPSQENRNCIEIITPFITELHSRGLLEHVQLMGGVGSAALKHPGTVILLDEQRIATTADFVIDNPDLSDYRPNQTKRDVDTLVTSSDPVVVEAVKNVAEEVIGESLEREIFPFKSGDYLDGQLAHPLSWQSVKTVTSDRYETEGGLVKALFPFSVPLPAEAVSGWKLEVGEFEYPVLNPAAAIANYLTRSISGLRAKDFDKVQEMARQVFGKAPEMAEWIVDGPGRSQLELAAILQTLRHGNKKDERGILDVGGAIQIAAGGVKKLVESEAFMLKGASTPVQKSLLRLAVIKSRGLGFFESNALIVKLFQKYAEKHAHTFTKNE